MRTHSQSTRLVAIGLTALIYGCAQPQTQDPPSRGALGSPEVVYHPYAMPDTASPDSVRDDLATLLRGRSRPVGIKFGGHAFTEVDINRYEHAAELVDLLKEGGDGKDIDGLSYDNQHDLMYIRYKSISVSNNRFAISRRVVFPFDQILDGPITVTKVKDGYFPYLIQLQNQLSFRFDTKDLADAKRLADDLYFLQQHARKQADQWEAQAQALTARYRALKTKPPVSEEQRRFIVQANAMNQQKDYGRALELYQKALDLEPLSYPSAYFNMALLSAQLGRFRQAIASMKQYLLLEPEANDARSAQDKVYEWELMLGK